MAKTTDIYLHEKYDILRYFSYILYAFGTVCIIGGIFLFFKLQPNKPQDEYEAQIMATYRSYEQMAAIISLVVGVFTGIMMLIQAQLLTLFMDLEWNQREQIELQKQVIENLPDSIKQ